MKLKQLHGIGGVGRQEQLEFDAIERPNEATSPAAGMTAQNRKLQPRSLTAFGQAERRRQVSQPCRTLVRPPPTSCLPADRKALRRGLPLPDAIRVKSAEYWLGLGHASEAVSELEKISEASKGNGWVMQIRISASRALRAARETMLSS